MNDEQKLKGSSLITHHSSLIRAASLLYLLNILLTVKIALLELTAFFALFCLCWAIVRKEAKFSFHILYFPLFVYGFASMLSSWFSGRHSYQAYGILWFKILIFPVAVMLYREVPRLRELATYAFAIVAGGGACWGLLQFLFLDQ